MNIENLLSELSKISKTCEEQYSLYEEKGFDDVVEKLEESIRKVARSSSNSWLGYQSRVYYRGFQPPRPGDHFSTEWGFESIFNQPVSDNRIEYSPEDVKYL